MGTINSIFWVTFALCCYQIVNHLPVTATSTLNQGNRLNTSSFLESDGRNFALGFFTIPATNSTYLGIQDINRDNKSVWIANPNRPGVGELTIDSSGTLKVIRGEDTFFNLSDQVGSGNTRAVLEDTGNFVLLDVADNRVLWQSFDHPTDTLLANMKLGFNLTTGQNWTLTSWLRDQVPASGSFSLSLERIQDSGQLVIRRRGNVYWTSGPWVNQNFLLLPQLNDTSNLYRHSLNFVEDSSGMYFTFQTSGETSSSMLRLDPQGKILDVANQRILPFSTPFCYGYESDNGCATSELPNCRGNKDSFEQRSGDFRGGGSSHYDTNTNLSLSDCMERCWNDCNCAGFRTNSNGTGCITWNQDTPFIQDDSGQTLGRYVLVSQRSPKSKAWIWVLVALAIVGALLLASLLCYLKIRRRRLQEEEKRKRNEYIKMLTASDSFDNYDIMEKSARDAPDLKIFSCGAIEAATDNFSSEKKLGEGGFGPVYKGKLLDGREIAVKRLSRTSGQGLEEFKNELILISKLQHTYLVRVLGCCIRDEEKMLVYEYMPNKSLDFFLFAQDKNGRLDWQKRFNIIEGVAQGLLYLHKYSRMRVIHRDLKASNVLLDENMNPKIADFGMARIFRHNETEAITNRVVGTYGYMSPEYAMEGTFSIKSDVFSFGVLVLEIVSGRKNSSFYQLDRPLNLVGYAWQLWKQGMALELKDPMLEESCDMNQLQRTIHVGLLCVQESAIDRPTIPEVISMLSNETMPLLAPKQPAFFTGRNASDDSSSKTLQTDGLQASINGLSMSVMEAR